MLATITAVVIVHSLFAWLCFSFVPHPYNYWTSGGSILIGVGAIMANLIIFDFAAKSSRQAEKCIKTLIQENYLMRLRLFELDDTGEGYDAPASAISVDAVEMEGE